MPHWVACAYDILGKPNAVQDLYELHSMHFPSAAFVAMTLIVAMLIMIYKKENEIGFKTAKRRIKIELQELVSAIIVVLSGGDLRKVDLPAP